MFGKYNADKKLVKKLLSGDEASFDVFYEEYFDKLYRFVLSRVDQQHHVAEDIVQSSLCKAIDKLSTFGLKPVYSRGYALFAVTN